MQYPKIFKAFNTHIDLDIDAYQDLEDRLIHKKLDKKVFYLEKVKWLNTCHLLMMG